MAQDSKRRFALEFGSEKAHHKILDQRPANIGGLLKHANHPSIHNRLVRHDNADYRADYAPKATNPDHIDRLVHDEDSFVRSQVAMNPNAQPHHLDHLIHDPDLAVRRTASHHKNLTLDQAKSMDHSDYSVGLSLSRFPEMHDKLVKHPDEGVRAAVANNPNVSEHHALNLIGDPSPEVRGRLARNLTHREATHPLLMHDEHPMVRKDVAEKTSMERAQHMMKHDPDKEVQIAAYKRVMQLRDGVTPMPNLFHNESTTPLNSFIQFTNKEQD